MKTRLHHSRWGRTLAALAFIILLQSVSAEENKNADVGRYQIVSGTLETTVKTDKTVTTIKAPVIIKIDTATGETWYLASVSDPKNGFRQGWISLDDSSPGHK